MSSEKIYGEYPIYYKQPFKWFRYHAHSKPHFVAAVALGVSAPFLILVGTPLRRLVYSDHVPIPQRYPLPTRPRDEGLTGYDD